MENFSGNILAASPVFVEPQIPGAATFHLLTDFLSILFFSPVSNQEQEKKLCNAFWFHVFHAKVNNGECRYHQYRIILWRGRQIVDTVPHTACSVSTSIKTCEHAEASSSAADGPASADGSDSATRHKKSMRRQSAAQHRSAYKQSLCLLLNTDGAAWRAVWCQEQPRTNSLHKHSSPGTLRNVMGFVLELNVEKWKRCPLCTELSCVNTPRS